MIYNKVEKQHNNNRKRTDKVLAPRQRFIRTKQERKQENKIDSPVLPPWVAWAPFGTNKYFKATGVINEAYRKMLIIGQPHRVFRDKHVL